MNDTTDDTNVGEVEASSDAATLAEYLTESLTETIKARIRAVIPTLLAEIAPLLATAGLVPSEPSIDPAEPSIVVAAAVDESVDDAEAKEAKPAREPREAIDDDAVAAAVEMVERGDAKSVAPNVLLAAKRRHLIVCTGRGRFAKYALTDEGKEILAALAEFSSADHAEACSSEELADLASVAARSQ